LLESGSDLAGDGGGVGERRDLRDAGALGDDAGLGGGERSRAPCGQRVQADLCALMLEQELLRGLIRFELKGPANPPSAVTSTSRTCSRAARQQRVRGQLLVVDHAVATSPSTCRNIAA